MRIILKLIILFFSIFVHAGEKEKLPQKPECNDGLRSVSILNLIVTPEKYDGFCVRVQGVFRAEFEGNALFLNKESFENYIGENSITLTFNDHLVKHVGNLEKFNGEYQLIEGIFHFESITSGGSAGYISGIYRLSDFYHLVEFYRK